MPDRSAGTVTFLFTDVEGSTALLRQLRERYGDVLVEHQRLLRAAFEQAGGEEIDTQGDAFFVVFHTAREAVQAAVDAQRALAGHVWPDGAELRVRIGIHTGEARLEEGRYLGLAVHRAARISAAGRGGQILLSHTTQSLLEDEEELTDVGLRDLGEQRLKDFDRPVRLYQVIAPGLRVDFPPLQTDDAKAAETVPFAGREEELAEAALEVMRPGLLRRRRLRIAIAGTVAAALVGAGAFLLLVQEGEETTSVPAVIPNSLVKIDPTTNRVLGVVDVGSAPGAVVFAAGDVWVLNEYDRTITRVDPGTDDTTTFSAELENPCCLASDGAAGVWVSGYGSREVKRLDAISSRPDRVVRLSVEVHGSGDFATSPRLQGLIAADGSELWLVHEDEARVRRVNAHTGTIVADHKVDLNPFAVSYGQGSAWVSSFGGNAVTEIRSSDDVVRAIPVAGGPSATAIDADSLWVYGYSDGRVRRVDIASGATTDIVQAGKGPAHSVRLSDVAFGFGAVWVTFGEGAVLRIDADNPSDATRIELGHRAGVIAIGAGAVWVTVQEPIT